MVMPGVTLKPGVQPLEVSMSASADPCASALLGTSWCEETRMTRQSGIERDKAAVQAFYQAGIDGHLTSFARHLDPDFTWTAPQALLDKLDIAHRLAR
jgi:hypothetical protein